MTYLELCLDLCRKAAIPRTGFTDVTAPGTDEHEDAVNWITGAWNELQTEQSGQWKFLQTEYSRECRAASTLDAAAAFDQGDGTVRITVTGHGYSAGDLVYIEGTTNYDGTWTLAAATTTDYIFITTTYVAETFAGTEVIGVRDYEFYTTDSVQSFDLDSFYIYTKTDGRSKRSKLNYIEYKEFNSRYQDYTTPSDISAITITPDKRLRLSALPDSVFVIEAVAFDTPQEMAANDDVPVMPSNFHRLIVWRALQDYGGFEESASIFQHGGIRMMDLYNQLLWQEKYETEEMVIRAL
jgi:hypothetical protein